MPEVAVLDSTRNIGDMIMKLKLKTIVLAGILGASTVSLQAALLFTENFDGGGVGSFSGSGENLDSATYTDPAVTAQIGSNFLSMYTSHTITATLGATFVDGTSYALNFSNFRRDFGVVSGRPITAIIGYDNGSFNALETVTFGAVSGVTELFTRSVTYQGTAGAENGQSIAIRFQSNSGDGSAGFQAGIDNVSFSIVTPEPGSLGLIGLGIALLSAARKRKI